MFQPELILAGLPSLWDPLKSPGAWTACLCIMFTLFVHHFVQRATPEAIRAERERKKKHVLAMMRAVLEYAEEDAARPARKQSPPEADRVRELLWDTVHGCRTTAWGIAPEHELNQQAEALYKRVMSDHVRRTIDWTRRARAHRSTTTVATGDKDEQKKLADHDSGELLLKVIEADRLARKNMGHEFGVGPALHDEAKELAKEVQCDQSKNARVLLRLLRPVLPTIAMSIFFGTITTILRAKFHQLGVWVEAIEAGTAGDVAGARTMLFRLWIGHMLIKLIELPESAYAKRGRSVFGNIIRNGVLSAMVSQDYEYFDKTPASVLQDRLNRDADELGENLVEFPKELLLETIWVGCNLYLVYMQTPTSFFMLACCPVFLMTAFQFITFKYTRACNERARRIEEQGVSETSEVLRQIKTVRQFASEQVAAASYARGGLSRQLIGERVFVTKRVAECIVWCIFDSGIALTIFIGFPFVASGQMTVAQLIDTFIKLNFHINFCLQKILDKIPRMARLLEPMGRICDLLQSAPTIEPSSTPPCVSAQSGPELKAVLACCAPRDDQGQTKSVVVSPMPALEHTAADAAGGPLAPDSGGQGGDAAAEGSFQPGRGAELLYLSSNDHQHVRVGDCRQVETERLSYPVRAVFSSKLRPARFRGKIEFRNVHFAYPTELRKPVLRGLSFVVEPGQKVALVGPTGCGKSSCMSLLQRLYDPHQGTILLDDIPLAAYDIQHLRSRVVIVDQNTVLFSSTIRDNITYGIEREVSDEEVIQACRDAQAWEFISEKPDKLMTMITGGSNLSGGQKQRLAIARAIIRKPDVILLDEATSALDNENEAKVQKALDHLAQQGSALVIAHRLSTIKDSDVIVVVDQGRVVESGSHDELLEKPLSQSELAHHELTAASPMPPTTSNTSPTPSHSRALTPRCSPHASPPASRHSSEWSALEANGNGADDAELPALNKPLRQKSAPSVLKPVDASGTSSYRRLWEAATGAGEKLSLSTMQAKMQDLEQELALLKLKHRGMTKQKAMLLESTARTEFLGHGQSGAKSGEA